MSESRYAIISSLTKQKTDLLGSKHSLDDDITRAKNRYDAAKKEAPARKKSIDIEAVKDKASVDSNVAEAKTTLDDLKSRKNSKVKMYDEKIKAINDALKQIESISEKQE